MDVGYERRTGDLAVDVQGPSGQGDLAVDVEGEGQAGDLVLT